MASRIEVRGDTAVNWTAANPVLAAREIATETDTKRMKIGDGATPWTGLGYVTHPPSALDADVAAVVTPGGSATAAAIAADPALRAAYVAATKPAAGSYISGANPGRVILVDDPSGTYGTGVVFGNVAGFTFGGTGTPNGIFAPFVIYQRYGDTTGGSNTPIPKTTQAGFVSVNYYGPTSDDSAEGFSSVVNMKDTGTPYTQHLKVTGSEWNVQIEGGNQVLNDQGAYVLGNGSRIILLGTSHVDNAYGFKSSIATGQNGVGGSGATVSTWRGFYDDLYNPATVNNRSVFASNDIHGEQSLSVSRSSYGASAIMDLSGGATNTGQALLTLVGANHSTSRTVTDAAITSGQKTVTSATAAWSIPTDIGKTVTITGAGASGGVLAARLVNAVGNVATLDTVASTTVSGASLTVAEPDLRTLRLVAGTGQTNANLEASNPADGTGGWNARVTLGGVYQTAGPSAGFSVFRNYNDATANVQFAVASSFLRDYPTASPTQGHVLNTGTSFGLTLAGATAQKLGFHGATPTAQLTRVGQLTDSTGGTVSTTLAAITDTATKNAVASLAAKVNALEAVLSAAAGGKGLTA